jgi:hypothetical protein
LLASIKVPRHHLRPEVELGEVPVVSGAHQADVVEISAPSKRERIPVVVLQVVTLGASTALSVRESALTAVTAIDGTTDIGWDVP